MCEFVLAEQSISILRISPEVSARFFFKIDVNQSLSIWFVGGMASSSCTMSARLTCCDRSIKDRRLGEGGSKARSTFSFPAFSAFPAMTALTGRCRRSSACYDVWCQQTFLVESCAVAAVIRLLVSIGMVTAAPAQAISGSTQFAPR